MKNLDDTAIMLIQQCSRYEVAAEKLNSLGYSALTKLGTHRPLIVKDISAFMISKGHRRRKQHARPGYANKAVVQVQTNLVAEVTELLTSNLSESMKEKILKTMVVK
jgi:hypothetical protein